MNKIPPLESATIRYDRTMSLLTKKDYWVNCKEIVYSSPLWGEGSLIKVPVGFHTDGASVPRIFWNIVPPWGDHGTAAIIHDFLCVYKTISVDGKLIKLTNHQIDHIFNEILKTMGVGKVKRKIIYHSVRLWDILGFRSRKISKRSLRQ